MFRYSNLTGIVRVFLVGVLLASTAWSQGAMEDQTAEEVSFVESLQGGSFTLGLRYRFETVDQASFQKDANASTLRTVLGYSTAPWKGMWFEVQAEGTTELGFEDDYNNKGAGSLSNGVTDRPVVADPGITEFNQVFVGFELPGENTLRIGRQEVGLADQRFLGPVGWRQNHQSLDAVRFDTKSSSGNASLTYLYIDQVHRIFGDRLPMASHAIDGSWKLSGATLGGFAYYLDYEAAGQPLSSLTVGFRAQGSVELGPDDGADSLGLGWQAQVARQEDAADNPRSFSADYFALSGSLAKGQWKGTLGLESLGEADEGAGFSTPLATLHKFNGWADMFLGTPSEGLFDSYAGVAWKQGAWAAQLIYHRFDPETGGGHYGDEVDGVVSFKADWGQLFLLKLADYSADDFAVDTRKVWLQTSWGF